MQSSPGQASSAPSGSTPCRRETAGVRWKGECGVEASCFTSPLSTFPFRLWLPGSSELNVKTILMISLGAWNICFFILPPGLNGLFLFIIYVVVYHGLNHLIVVQKLSTNYLKIYYINLN